MIFRVIWTCLFLIIAASSAQSQDWNIGNLKATNNSGVKDVLMRGPFGASMFTTLEILQHVGGVNFELKLKKPFYEYTNYSHGPKIQPRPWIVRRLFGCGSWFDIEYNDNLPDGERLRLSVGHREYSVRLFDWELFPIAKFANSKYTAAVSLFGADENTNMNKQFDPIDYYYVQFHPALKDTLFGMRILQSDLFFTNPVANAAPPRLGGSVPSGGGEAPFSRANSNFCAGVLEEVYFYGVMNFGQPSSWILSDNLSSAHLSYHDNSLNVQSLLPYYFFWTLSPDESIVRIQEIENMISRNEDLLYCANPWSRSAVRKLSEFAALFRSFKDECPIEWDSFVDEITYGNEEPTPIIQTPNLMRRY